MLMSGQWRCRLLHFISDDSFHLSFCDLFTTRYSPVTHVQIAAILANESVSGHLFELKWQIQWYSGWHRGGKVDKALETFGARICCRKSLKNPTFVTQPSAASYTLSLCSFFLFLLHFYLSHIELRAVYLQQLSLLFTVFAHHHHHHHLEFV